MDYGMKDKDPISTVWFYSKAEPDKAKRPDQVSQMLPKHFSETLIFVYCKQNDEKSIREAKKCFDAWRTERNFAEPVVCIVQPFRQAWWNVMTFFPVAEVQYFVFQEGSGVTDA